MDHPPIDVMIDNNRLLFTQIDDTDGYSYLKTLEYPFNEETYAEHGYPTQSDTFTAQYALFDEMGSFSPKIVSLHAHTLEMTDETVS